MPTVSLIIPIFNADGYLVKCLDSAGKQTLQDIEVICIINGSSDAVREIIKHRLESDGRFKTVGEPDLGYGASLNLALDAATGEYIAILQSGDVLEPDALEKMVEIARGIDADVVKASYKLHAPGHEKGNGSSEHVPTNMAGLIFDPMHEQAMFYLTPSTRAMLYRRDTIDENDVRFFEAPTSSCSETGFMFKMWSAARRAAFIPDSVLACKREDDMDPIDSPDEAYLVCDEYSDIERYLVRRPEKRNAFEGVKERLKYDAYISNYEHLSNDLKIEFLERAADEFRKEIAAGDVDFELFELWTETELRLLVRSPLDFDRYHDRYQQSGKANTFKRYQHIGGLTLVTQSIKRGLKSRKAPKSLGTIAELRDMADVPSQVEDIDIELDCGKPLMSIIIPVCDAEKHLGRCLDALAAQTLQDIEVICIDDESGESGDGSADIVRRRHRADSRFKLIDNPGKGTPSARNAGLSMAKADFVTFLDAGDTLEPDACETMLAAMLAEQADVLTFGVNIVPEDGVDLWILDHVCVSDKVVDGFDPDILFDHGATFCFCSAFRREFLETSGLRFDENLSAGEDELFLIESYTLASRTALISNKLYAYQQDLDDYPEQGTDEDADSWTVEECMRNLDVVEAMFAFWKKRFPNGEYLEAIIDWSVEYALYGALAFDRPQRTELTQRYREAFLNSWTMDDARSAALSPMTQKIVLITLSGEDMGDTYALSLRAQGKVRNSAPAAAAYKIARRFAG